MTASNPLLALTDLPEFADIRASHVVPAVKQAIAEHAKAMQALAASPGAPDLLERKALADLEIGRVWGVVGHLLSVVNSPELREAHGQAQPLIDAYFSTVGQDKALYAALAAIAPEALPQEQRRALALALQEFELSGVALEGDAATRFAENSVELGRLSTEFSNALLDATQGWHHDVTDVGELAGLPEADLASMAAAAKAAGVEGWRITLHAPSVMAVLAHGENRPLRAKVYEAHVTRASEVGPQAGLHDNGPRMRDILSRRASAALMLGHDDHVSVSLASKMARDGAQVESFLQGLAQAARPRAAQELAELADFAAKELGIADLQAWDVGFVSERLRRAAHALDSGQIRQYLPLDTVLAALFALVGELFGLEFREAPGQPVWHEDVRHYTLHRPGQAEPVAGLYADFFAREGKRGGAWMNVCRPRLAQGPGGTPLWPVAYLITNFASPVGGQSPTITHNDMVTLFHEMGHCLHHMLSEVDLPSVAGISGVEWDAVELPSQFLENFAWEPATLKAASHHVETGEPLSDELIGRMLGARKFLGAMGLLRQVEFGLFDLRVHGASSGGDNAPDPQSVLDGVRAQVAVINYPAWNRFAHGFGHIFAGGYAAGYYSYLWAEQLSADAYAAFEEEVAPRARLGASFAAQVLARGGTRTALDNFVAFRQREPDSAALLKSWGVAA